MPIEAGATYVYDLGYYDYGWWAALDDAGCRFVTRLKKNTPLTVAHENGVPKDGNILSDRIGHLPQRLASSRHNPLQVPVRDPVEISRFPCRRLPRVRDVSDHAGSGDARRDALSRVAFRFSLHSVGTLDHQHFAARYSARVFSCQRFANALADADA
jgi:hypothetical protein